MHHGTTMATALTNLDISETYIYSKKSKGNRSTGASHNFEVDARAVATLQNRKNSKKIGSKKPSGVIKS